MKKPLILINTYLIPFKIEFRKKNKNLVHSAEYADSIDSD